ncbi:MAG: hypothetical protein K9G70_04585 [Prolixibacteraceae bacterium]|nr:hypothetical protein [Prolixibacteraceae bacterium]
MTHKTYLLILFSFLTVVSNSQNQYNDEWINFGQEGWGPAQWLQIAPGKMGPNALPAPRMDYALVGKLNKIEVGGHYHQMKGDTTANSYISFYWAVVPGKVAVEIWGQPSETFRTTNEVRDERQIWHRDEGWSTEPGDLYVSTYIQLIRDRKNLPDISINYTLKTTTGDNTNARYTNASMNYFYLAAGKSFYPSWLLLDEIRIAGLTGFYVWQTNLKDMAQDEGPVYELGIKLRRKSFNIHTEIGGYSGYGAYNFLNNIVGNETPIEDADDPLVYRAGIEKTGAKFDFKAEFQSGLSNDYPFNTLRMSVTYNFGFN